MHQGTMAKFHTIHVVLNVFLLIGLLGALVTFTWDGPIARGGAGQYTFEDLEANTTDMDYGVVCGAPSPPPPEKWTIDGYFDQNITSITLTMDDFDGNPSVRMVYVIDFKDVFDEYPANGHVTEMFILSWVFFFVSLASIIFVFYWVFLYGKDKRAAFEEKHRGLIKALHIFFYLLILAMSVTSIALMAMATGDDYKDQMDPSSLAKVDGVEPYNSDNKCWNDIVVSMIWNLAMTLKCTPSGIGDGPCNMPIFLILFYTTTSLLTATSLACLVVYMMAQEMWPFRKMAKQVKQANVQQNPVYRGTGSEDTGETAINQLVF